MSLNSDISLMCSYDDIMGTSGERAVGNWATLGPAVRDARTRAGLTQAALAERADVSRGWLVRFEAGLPNAEPVAVLRLLRQLDLELVLRPRPRIDYVFNDLAAADADDSADDADSHHIVIDLDAVLADLDAPSDRHES